MAAFKKFDIYYFVTLIFILLACNSNFLSAINACWLGILLFMIIVALVKGLLKAEDYKLFIKFAAVYLVFVILRDVFVNSLGADFIISDVIFLFKFVLISFIYCAIMREKLVNTMVRVTIHLTLISFVFYILQVVGFGPTIYNFSVNLNLPNAVGAKETTNFLIFTYSTIHAYRNCAFFWEPGAFACFLIFLLSTNLIINKFKFDRNNKILVVAVLTTASTTGYLALFVILFLWYRYKNPKVNFWVLFLIPIFFYLLTIIPFLGDKIVSTYKDDMAGLTYKSMKTQVISYRRTHEKKLIPLNRFASAEYIYHEFGDLLILGVSNKYDFILNKTFSVDISNGIFDFLAKFGVVGLLFLLYKYMRFCIYYLKRIELVIYAVIVFLTIGTGEPIVFLPFILIYLFIPYPQLGMLSYNVQRAAINPNTRRVRKINPIQPSE